MAEAGRGEKYRCLVAVGGDGTVSALVNEQPKLPITMLPAGTENLAAQHFGLKRDPAKLAQTIAPGGPREQTLVSRTCRRLPGRVAGSC